MNQIRGFQLGSTTDSIVLWSKHRPKVIYWSVPGRDVPDDCKTLNLEQKKNTTFDSLISALWDDVGWKRNTMVVCVCVLRRDVPGFEKRSEQVFYSVNNCCECFQLKKNVIFSGFKCFKSFLIRETRVSVAFSCYALWCMNHLVSDCSKQGEWGGPSPPPSPLNFRKVVIPWKFAGINLISFESLQLVSSFIPHCVCPYVWC